MGVGVFDMGFRSKDLLVCPTWGLVQAGVGVVVVVSLAELMLSGASSKSSKLMVSFLEIVFHCFALTTCKKIY